MIRLALALALLAPAQAPGPWIPLQEGTTWTYAGTTTSLAGLAKFTLKAAAGPEDEISVDGAKTRARRITLTKSVPEAKDVVVVRWIAAGDVETFVYAGTAEAAKVVLRAGVTREKDGRAKAAGLALAALLHLDGETAFELNRAGDCARKELEVPAGKFAALLVTSSHRGVFAETWISAGTGLVQAALPVGAPDRDGMRTELSLTAFAPGK